MQELVTDLFMTCVYYLQVIGGDPGHYGYGYYLANVLIFVIIEPLLILLFFVLWIRARRKNRKLMKGLFKTESGKLRI